VTPTFFELFKDSNLIFIYASSSKHENLNRRLLIS
jgi:hypothetical protein